MTLNKASVYLYPEGTDFGFLDYFQIIKVTTDNFIPVFALNTKKFYWKDGSGFTSETWSHQQALFIAGAETDTNNYVHMCPTFGRSDLGE